MELCNFFRNFEGWEGGEVPPGMASPGSLTHCHEKKVKIIEEIFGLFSTYSYVCYVMRETLNPLYDMNVNEMNRLVALYVDGSISDEQMWNALDTISGESSTLVEESHDYDWDVDNAVEYDYELEASRYDYL